MVFMARLLDVPSLSATYGIFVGGGIIDSGFRGNVKVILMNASRNDYRIYRGDKIGQFILHAVSTPALQEVQPPETRGRLLSFCLVH